MVSRMTRRILNGIWSRSDAYLEFCDFVFPKPELLELCESVKIFDFLSGISSTNSLLVVT